MVSVTVSDINLIPSHLTELMGDGLTFHRTVEQNVVETQHATLQSLVRRMGNGNGQCFFFSQVHHSRESIKHLISQRNRADVQET